MVTPVSSTLRAALISVYCRPWNEASSWRNKWTCTRRAGWPQASFTFALYWAILKSVKEWTITIHLVRSLKNEALTDTHTASTTRPSIHANATWMESHSHLPSCYRAQNNYRMANKISRKNHKAWNVTLHPHHPYLSHRKTQSHGSCG